MGGLSQATRDALRSRGMSIDSDEEPVSSYLAVTVSSIALTEAQVDTEIIHLSLDAANVQLPAPTAAMNGSMFYMVNETTRSIDVTIAGGLSFANDTIVEAGMTLDSLQAAVYVVAGGKWWAFHMFPLHGKPVEVTESRSLTADECGSALQNQRVICKVESGTITLPNLLTVKNNQGGVRIKNDATTDQKIHYTDPAGATKQVKVSPCKTMVMTGYKDGNDPPLKHYWSPPNGTPVTDPD